MSTKPTDAELAILNILWERGPLTVREVHEQLEDTGVGYTTTLKQLQVMQKKGFVTRDDSSRSHIYRAALGQEATQAALLDHLLDSAFGGSTSSLFMRALGRERTRPADLEEIRRLLDELEEGR